MRILKNTFNIFTKYGVKYLVKLFIDINDGEWYK